MNKRAYREGLTHSELNAIYSVAGGLCAICGSPRGVRNHALDHDHKTGKIRGVLCGRCNSGLGQFNDDVEVMQKAIDYLLMHRTTT